MNRMHCNMPAEQRRGVAAVECAIVLPVMLVLVLGLVEIGTALRATTIMQSAVREAGRLASMDWRYVVEEGETPNEKVEQDIRNFVTASGLPGDDLIVSIEFAEGASEGSDFDIADEDNELELMLIEIELPYASISLFPVRYMGGRNLREGVVSRAGIAGGSLTN
ncbi:MAG: TadE/TadG family type IV pilus assembly protein [Planctomycetaceae bacterium]|jgi:hypothetical protein